MRNVCTRYLVALLTLLAVGTAWAYNSGPDIIRECPKCNVHLKQHTTTSGNTFGASFWTDGKMLAPMLPDRPWLVKCPKCGSLLWIDEAKKIERQDRFEKEKKWPNAVEPSLPSEEDFLTVLSENKLAKKKKLYARRRAWWAANDAIRTNPNATIRFSPAQEKNLQALSNLMDEKDPGQRITKAEILRELGKFNECITLLAQPFDRDHHSKVAAFIMNLAEKKSRIVCEIKE